MYSSTIKKDKGRKNYLGKNKPEVKLKFFF